MSSKVITGAIAIIKDAGGNVIGLMRNVRCTESVRRQPVRGLGTILPSEKAVVEWEGTLSCSFMEVHFNETGVPGAINRNSASVASQVSSGGSSFEDNLVLDADGVKVSIFKKEKDVLNADGTIKPKLTPYATVRRCLIESDSFDISEGSIAGHDQSFSYLDPITYGG